MKRIQLFSVLSCFALVIYSCKTKKAVSSTAKSAEASEMTAPRNVSSLNPGEAELKAIKIKFPETTSKTLSDGYSIYSGVCTGCHKQKDMFKDSEKEWKHNVDRMAPKARITDIEKDALWKYILAMRTARGTKK